ncbi:MAG: glycogen-binding domain-containing protein, partial [Bacteroidota bacterium]
AFATKYGNVTFNLKGYKNAASVLVTGSFNRWDETNFKMDKVENGWTITLQLRPDRYEYKFIVDGEWLADPNNPDLVENEYHGSNSVINVTKIVEFKLWGHEDAEEVFLSGDFNDWSPETLQMEKRDGYWLSKVELSGGKHHYKFVVDGEWMTDPFNSVAEYDGRGNINSVCMVK